MFNAEYAEYARKVNLLFRSALSAVSALKTILRILLSLSIR